MRFGITIGEYLEIKYPTLGVRFIAIQENVDTLKNAGTDTEEGAVVMSLPVSAVAGFGMLNNLDNGEN